MSHCMEGYRTIGEHILNNLDVSGLIDTLKSETQKVAAILSELEPRIFFSSSGTNQTPIITMKDGKFSLESAMASKGGKIAAVGTKEEVESVVGKLESKYEIDLKDGSIVPGFVEPHLHIILSAMLQGFLTNCDPLAMKPAPPDQNLFDCTIQFLQKETGSLRPKDWFLGYGYDPSRLPVGSDGKFQDLNFAVFEANGLNKCPIFIINASGHLAYANLPAYQAAGVPSVGQDGILVEPACYTAFIKTGLPKNWAKLPKLLTGMLKTVEGWRQMGFTTVFDAGVGQLGKRDATILYTLSAIAGLRIAGAAADLNPNDAAAIVGSDPMPAGGATDLKIKTIKLWMDGSTQGFTAALSQEYNPQMLPSYFSGDPNGWARWEVSTAWPMKNQPTVPIVGEMQTWAKLGYQLMVHVNGDEAAEVVMNAFRQIPKSSIMHRLEHFTVTTPEQIAAAKELNLAVSHTIGHVRYWGDAFNQYILGSERAARVDPVKDDFDNGLIYSFNSDSPVSQADALSYVFTAVNRIMYPSGQQLGKEQCVSVEAALAGVTINPAKQILLEDEIGSLEVGKSADFVILSQNIASPTLDTTTILNDWVQETWFKGVNQYTKSPSQ